MLARVAGAKHGRGLRPNQHRVTVRRVKGDRPDLRSVDHKIQQLPGHSALVTQMEADFGAREYAIGVVGRNRHRQNPDITDFPKNGSSILLLFQRSPLSVLYQMPDPTVPAQIVKSFLIARTSRRNPRPRYFKCSLLSYGVPTSTHRPPILAVLVVRLFISYSRPNAFP
jgi:hypothetical protein